MSLQVWLPLNGNLNNQGISGENYSQTLTYGTGKVTSSCLNTNGVASNIHTYSGINSVTKWSVCCWLKIDSSKTFGQFTDFFTLGVNNSGATAGGFRIEHSNVAGAIQIVTTKPTTLTDTNPYYVFYSNSNCAKDNWVHFTITNDGTNYKTYINDSLVATTAISIFTTSTSTLTGSLTLGMSQAQAYINDFRVYDHCLSAKEVKEISKGLVLHYKLDNNGIGNPNLIESSRTLNDKWAVAGTSAWSRSYVNENDMLIWKATCTTSGTGGVHTHLFPKSTDKIGKIYTFSCKIKSNRNVRITTGHECGGNIGVNVTHEWQSFSHTWTFTDAAYQSFVWYISSGSWAANDWIMVKDFKIEQGNEATPWCPHTSDVEYSQLGLNSNIEYDCSGYRNHASKEGTFYSDHTSPRYDSALNNNKSGYLTLPSITINKQFTISVWFNSHTTHTSWERIFNIGDSGQNRMGYTFHNTSTNAGFHIYQNGTSIYDAYVSPHTNNTWNHFAVTYDGSTLIQYLNGVITKTSPLTTYNGFTYLTSNIYAMAGASPCNCSLSDFRLYATALSASDIKELYQTSASIDRSGNMYAYELKES